MKLCILGGGGFRTPHVYQSLLRDEGSPRITTISLYDVDENRLHSMTIIMKQLATGFHDAPLIVPTTSLHSAIEGSDFIFSAIRVGGLEGRRCDEHVALDLNVLGQETTGPGGIAYAIRTVPVTMEIARLIHELAPRAYVMNFTNPAGIITEAMQSVLGDRVLGICDTPSGLARRIASLLGLDHALVQPDYVGLNHLGWMRRILYKGEDVLPELLSNTKKLALLEESQIFGTDWIRTLGVIPNEYLFYYYFNRDAVRTIGSSKLTRGDFLAATQGEFFRQVAAAGNGAADLWRETTERRSASYMAEALGKEQYSSDLVRQKELDPSQEGYAGVALSVMSAIARNERTAMILNVRNGTTIQGLPADAVIEVPTMVDANGVHPQTTTQPSLDEIGLMQQVKAVERHAIAAAVTGSRDEALKAFALHPLVDSVTVARDLLASYVARMPEMAKILTK